MNFGTGETKDPSTLHKEGKKYNDEVKALIDAGVHKKTENLRTHAPTHRL